MFATWAAINATYALPFGLDKQYLNGMSDWENRFVSGWSLASIVTIQSGFPFTPQLSYNPSNNGDTRNPVRPFINPSFTGPVITGNPSQWFNPTAFLEPPNNSGFYGNLGRDTLIGPGLATLGFFRPEGYPDSRVSESSVSCGNFQSAKPGEFQYAESNCVYTDWSIAIGRSHHGHGDDFPAGSIWAETNFLTVTNPLYSLRRGVSNPPVLG